MKFIEVRAAGGPEVLQLASGSVPRPAQGEVLIAVKAAGVNRPDLMQRAGLYPPPPKASPILGLEVAGIVESVGDGVSQWQVGDSVCGLTNGGGYAEYAVLPAAQCLPVPKGLDFGEAAALPETFFTVWSNVFDRGNLQPGETLLIHGGSSGIGTAAIQMAKAWGATVIVTAGSDAKCEACKTLGADRVINYRTEDFVTAVKAFTAKAGADVILDMVGGDYVQRNLSAAAVDGRIVNIAFQQGSQVKLEVMPIMLKRLTLTGSTLRPRSAAYKAEIADKLRQHIWPLIEAGKIRPWVHRRFPLAAAGEAHGLLESGEVIGKLVLELG